MKKGFIFFVMLVSVLALGFSQTTQWTVTNSASWIDAVNGVRIGGNNKSHNITFNGNISVPMSDGNTFGDVTGITVTLEGSGSLTTSSNGGLLRVGSGQTVIVRNLTLQGRNRNSASVVRITDGGTFRMQGRASVTGNSSGEGFLTTGVYVNGGTFIMEDNSSVMNNSVSNPNGSADSGGVRVDAGGTFTMQGGTISGNTVIANGSGSPIIGNARGGGVFVSEGGTFNMQGGIITRNTATSRGTMNAHAYGGGVYFGGDGTFNMQGGTISANTVSYDSLGREGRTLYMGSGTLWSASGGGVFVGGSSTFTMISGSITGNNSNDAGGGLYIGGNSSFTMSNGSISGNTASSSGAGVDVHGNFAMTGGEISGNIGGGVDVYGNFTMKNGKISGNGSATWNGGGVCVNSGTFSMENGEISGNTASDGGGVYVSSNSVFVKTGGVIYGNNAAQNLRNTLADRNGKGHSVNDAGNGRWRNSTAESTMNTNTYGFWLND